MEQPIDPRQALRDLYVFDSKVDAFCKAFDPATDPMDPRPGIRTFTDADLRRYFNAYPKTCGDPLVIYVDELLADRGFRFQTSPLGDEPVIVVIEK